jgi:hypothetical protein
MRRLINAILFFLLLGGCVSRRQVVGDYDKKKLKLSLGEGADRPQTLVFFLVDGFSVRLTQKLLSEERIPNIKNFFLPERHEFYLARSTFPSLTHVNMSAILTSRNVDTQPVIGNKILRDGKILNLESPFAQDKFSELVRPYSIFTELSRQKRASMSFAPYYGDGATARYGLDLKMGFAYRFGDYAYVDAELLQSFVFALEKIPVTEWPEFIFVHIMGIDGTEHRHGEVSKEVIDYAEDIDRRLADVFELLQKAVSEGRQIGAVMTSDHGMSNLKDYVSIDEAVSSLAPGATLINQGRMMGVHFDPAFPAREKDLFASSAATLPGVEMVVHRKGDTLSMHTPSKVYTLRYQDKDCGRDGNYALSLEGRSFLCPSQLNRVSEKFYYPYFATNLAAYFRAKESPDAILLAREQTSFGANLHAHHGGMTPGEILVPLLLWNLDYQSAEKHPQTHRLLETFRQPRD